MASKMTAQHLQRLQEELSRVNDAIRTLEGKRDGLRIAISVMKDDAPVPSGGSAEAPRRQRAPLKDALLQMLSEAGPRGLVAAEAVEIGKARGLDVDRNSASSLLSRFKRDGVLEHVDGRYRVPQAPLREIKDAA